jgi:hypothetical protein
MKDPLEVMLKELNFLVECVKSDEKYYMKKDLGKQLVCMLDTIDSLKSSIRYLQRNYIKTTPLVNS